MTTRIWEDSHPTAPVPPLPVCQLCSPGGCAWSLSGQISETSTATDVQVNRYDTCKCVWLAPSQPNNEDMPTSGATHTHTLWHWTWGQQIKIVTGHSGSRWYTTIPNLVAKASEVQKKVCFFTIWACTVTLTLKIGTQPFCKTLLRVMMMHYHTKFGCIHSLVVLKISSGQRCDTQTPWFQSTHLTSLWGAVTKTKPVWVLMLAQISRRKDHSSFKVLGNYTVTFVVLPRVSRDIRSFFPGIAFTFTEVSVTPGPSILKS